MITPPGGIFGDCEENSGVPTSWWEKMLPRRNTRRTEELEKSSKREGQLQTELREAKRKFTDLENFLKTS